MFRDLPLNMAVLQGVFGPGIRRRLVTLSLALTLPLALMAAGRAFERLQSERANMRERGTIAATRATQLLDDDMNRARLLLAGASRVLDPRASIPHNDTLIASIFGQAASGFSNIWVADTAGNVRGTLRPLDSVRGGANLAAREYFREALSRREFTIGQPVRSRVDPSSSWVLPFIQPVRDARNGALVGFVGAGLRIDQMAAVRYVRDLPPNSVLTVLRDDGRVLLRTRDLDTWVTRNFRDSPDFQLHQKLPTSMQQISSLDGTSRLVAQDTMITVAATAYVGIPVSESLALVERQFALDLVIGLLVTAVLAVFAVGVSRRLTTPLQELADVAESIARGDRTKRARIVGNDEITVLARAVNDMADAVQDRQRELESSETRYRQLFATTPLPTLTWSLSDGRIEQVNDAARAFFGTERFAGREPLRILDLIAEDERDRFSLLPVPSHNETMSAGLWRQRDAHGDERAVELYVSQLEQVQGTVVVGVVLDTTDRRRAEAALEHSRERLRQAQQLEALGAFAGGIAHDFNNYLSAIGTNAELLRDALAHDSPLRQEAAEILAAAQRASHLTRQILVFSKRQVVKEHQLDVNAELSAMHHLLTHLVGERIAVHMECGTGVADIMFSRERFEQVLMNLCANARDAMPDGGRLTISTSAHGNEVEIRVRDTGAGIAPDVLPRVFDPFFTTKTRDRGTGLGLAMVYSIVTGARGRITVQSELGRGTEFTVTLPGVQHRQPQPEAVAPATAHRGREHVLVVEDDPAVRSGTASLLSRAGYRVSVASGGEEALEQFRTLETLPDIVLTDVVMPGMGGSELAERLRTTYPSVRVVFMSGFADDDALVRGLSANALEFVAKPFSAGELLGAIRRVLDAAPTS